MAIEVQQLKDDEIFVNDKLVIKDSNDNWIAKVELTHNETLVLHRHIKSIARSS